MLPGEGRTGALKYLHQKLSGTIAGELRIKFTVSLFLVLTPNTNTRVDKYEGPLNSQGKKINKSVLSSAPQRM